LPFDISWPLACFLKSDWRCSQVLKRRRLTKRRISEFEQRREIKKEKNKKKRKTQRKLTKQKEEKDRRKNKRKKTRQ
jgi:hypothetical protein